MVLITDPNLVVVVQSLCKRYTNKIAEYWSLGCGRRAALVVCASYKVSASLASTQVASSPPTPQEKTNRCTLFFLGHLDQNLNSQRQTTSSRAVVEALVRTKKRAHLEVG